MILDSHTHIPAPHSVLCVEPWQLSEVARSCPAQLLAVGIHPWSLADVSDAGLDSMLEQLRVAASHPQVVAIGETGLDTLCRAPMELQRASFQAHIRLAGTLCLPLILHVVRTSHEILSCLSRRSHTDTTPWIWHGFRGKPLLAAAFLAHPHTCISLGPRFNSQVPSAIPLSRLLLETDATPSASSHPTILDVASRVAPLLSPPLTPSELLKVTSATARSIFIPPHLITSTTAHKE